MSGRKLLLFAITVATYLCATPAQAPGATALPADWQRGANVTAWWHDAYQQPKADQELARLKASGSTHASFVVTWYMNDQHDSQVSPDPQRTPTDASLLHSLAKARSLGMSVALKPHVDLQDGSFRGTIAPGDVSTWFSDYRTMIEHYADIARQSGAEMLVVGTELSTMTPHQEQWRALIAGVRSRFGGKLTFAANHIDAAAAIGFWDALDYIGIDAYEPLSWSDPSPSADALASGWCDVTDSSGRARHYFGDIAALQARWNKPVMFTELGYQSKIGAALTPWGGAAGPASQQAQANAYEAAYRVWSRVPWFKGIYWWNWDAGAGNDDPGNGGFEFAGKAAGATVAAWNTATAPPEPGLPCSTTSPAPRTVVTLAVKIKRRGGRRVLKSLNGRVMRGSLPCKQAISVNIERRGRRRGRATRVSLRSSTGSAGQFSISPRRLRAGRYRASASTGGAGCGAARSARVRFRTR